MNRENRGGAWGRGQVLCFAAVCAVFAGVSVARAQGVPEVGPQLGSGSETGVEEPAAVVVPTPEIDQLSYDYERFRVAYATDHPALPVLEQLLEVRVPLIETAEGYIAPRPDDPGQLYRLRDLVDGSASTLRDGGETRVIYQSAIARSIAPAIVRELNRRGLIGVLVAIDPDQVDPRSGIDNRDFDDIELRLLIWAGTVADVRTVGSGRFERFEAINHPAHERIRRNSPVRPYDASKPDERRRDLVRRDLLDSYVYRLNRHPGRRVDVAVAPGGDPLAAPDRVTLDYLVSEARPWSVYAQYSNTGTESTSEWRQRYGFTHNQVTNSDDTFSLDYITSAFNPEEFEDTNTWLLDYERPMPFFERARLRGYGSYSEFTAEDVGDATQDFSGRTNTVGGEGIVGIYQRGRFFTDMFGGFRLEDIRVNNAAAATTGENTFLFGYVGARAQRTTQTSSVFGEVSLERTFNNAVSNDASQNDNLGRFGTDPDWTTLLWDAGVSFYLEPLLNPGGWRDPSTPESSTLAHELVFSFRGQYPFGSRLIPQKQAVVGGQGSVRGYPESVAAGDSSYIWSAEYRLHIPRLLGIDDTPPTLPVVGPFRVAPQQVYGFPDWDLILRGFADAARVESSDQGLFEAREDLVGVGLGFEAAYRQNLTASFDFGWALDGTSDDTVKPGSAQVHISITVLY